MRSRRGAMELSVATVVMLILGIVILGLGATIIWKIVDVGEEYVGDVTKAQAQQLLDLHDSGYLVAVVPQRLDVKAGERAQVAIGVQSILQADETFRIAVAGTGPDGQPVPLGSSAGAWRTQYFPDFAVPAERSASAAFAFTPDAAAPRGTYTFIITVKRADGTVYDTPRAFVVRVQ